MKKRCPSSKGMWGWGWMCVFACAYMFKLAHTCTHTYLQGNKGQKKDQKKKRP
jgi:hypothetical protein